MLDSQNILALQKQFSWRTFSGISATHRSRVFWGPPNHFPTKVCGYLWPCQVCRSWITFPVLPLPGWSDFQNENHHLKMNEMKSGSQEIQKLHFRNIHPKFSCRSFMKSSPKKSQNRVLPPLPATSLLENKGQEHRRHITLGGTWRRLGTSSELVHT